MLPVMIRKNLFPMMFDELMSNGSLPRNAGTVPAMNVKESTTDYTMEIAVPGIKKEYCHINITDEGYLSVGIEFKIEKKEDEAKPRYLRREFVYANSSQKYNLPEDVDKDTISARVENGILTIVLPKLQKEEMKISRQIEVA